MRSNNSNGSLAASARGFVALGAILAIGRGLMASSAEAAPFAYVTNRFQAIRGAGSVSVIDTPINKVVATIVVGNFPEGVAVTPDGKHAYVANLQDNSVSVIDTVTNSVVATVGVGGSPTGVAVTPDGKHTFVANQLSNTVSVINTASNKVVATVPVRNEPFGVAVTPGGKHAYVANGGSNTVSVIDTAANPPSVAATLAVGSGPVGVAVTPDGKRTYVTNEAAKTISVINTASNKVVATVLVGNEPFGVAITPDGTHAYVTNFSDNTVSVIDTATNPPSVVATLAVGSGPVGVAVTPDGTHAYVANLRSHNVSVIDTANNTVEAATLAVGMLPNAVGIVPPPPGVPFLAFSAKLAIHFGGASEDTFNLHLQGTLSSTAPWINPVTQPVTLQVGTFTTTIPPGSFKQRADGTFSFKGVIDGVSLEALIKPTGTLRYAFHAKATDASLAGTKNNVYVTLIIGGDSGATSVQAQISP